MGMNGRSSSRIATSRSQSVFDMASRPRTCGKTNFLECLAQREVPIPDHIDLYHLREEAEPTESALQTVDELKNEMVRLQKLEEYIMENFGPGDGDWSPSTMGSTRSIPTPSRSGPPSSSMPSVSPKS